MTEKILIISTSAYLAEKMKDKIKNRHPDCSVSVMTDTKEIAAAPEKINADILLLETNCWYGATPQFIPNILEHNKNLSVGVFAYELLPSDAIASFFQNGAMCYIDNRDSLERQYEGIASIIRGSVYVPPQYRKKIKNTDCRTMKDTKLTLKERWLCRLICLGMNINSCAEIMVISPSTARFYKAEIHAKLNVHTTAALVEKCKQLGIIKPGEIFRDTLSEEELKIICGRGKDGNDNAVSA
jgi:DNA-binding NarL/FixJ family response regulator